MDLYEMLKARKVGWSNDFLTNIYAKAFGGSQPDFEHEYTGVVPHTFTADGTPLIDWYIKGNMSQSGTPTPDNPIMPEGCGDLETIGAKAGQYKIPISSANTTTPVYLGEVQTTRRIKKLVLTGEENITSGHLERSLFNITVSGYLKENIITVVCSHYNPQANVSEWGHVLDKRTAFHAGASSTLLYIRDSTYATVDDFKSYLAAQYTAGTPVTVWYVLATEEAAVVNEPLMKIGEYADTLTATQAEVEIPTANGINTFDVNTTVKPATIYIKWKG